MVKFASPSCVCFIYFGFLLATICVWVWMVCSLHSVTTGSRDRANMPLIIIMLRPYRVMTIYCIVSDTLCITHVHCPLYINNGCGKREAHINWSMVIPYKAAPITGTINTLRTTTILLIAVCWRTAGKLVYTYSPTFG